MNQVIGISGRKQSGKDTTCNFLHGYELLRNNVINGFAITDKGKLVVEIDGLGHAELNLDQKTVEFREYASQFIWPFVKKYAFADSLKEICIQFFNLDENKLYGTNEDKNTPTEYKWEDIPGSKKSGIITYRDFLKSFGTDICRSIKTDIWSEFCIKQILLDQSPLSIVTDCRFEDEIEAVQKAGGVTLRLLRDPYEDDHESEKALDNYKGFDFIIDNRDLSIPETNTLIKEKLVEAGILQECKSL